MDMLAHGVDVRRGFQGGANPFDELLRPIGNADQPLIMLQFIERGADNRPSYGKIFFQFNRIAGFYPWTAVPRHDQHVTGGHVRGNVVVGFAPEEVHMVESAPAFRQ